MTQWTWVWVDSRSWWWTGRPGVLRFMGLQRVRHDWEFRHDWTELNSWKNKLLFINILISGCSPESMLSSLGLCIPSKQWLSASVSDTVWDIWNIHSVCNKFSVLKALSPKLCCRLSDWPCRESLPVHLSLSFVPDNCDIFYYWGELNESPWNSYFEVLTSNTSECDCIWTSGLYRG